MSVDILQDRIRKLKSPLILDLAFQKEHIPHCLCEEAGMDAYYVFCRRLLEGLHQKVAGVRFKFDWFALMGDLRQLSELMKYARELGYYVLLDGPSLLSPWDAENAATAMLDDESLYPCHGLILSSWIGSDGMKPFLPYCKANGKSLFFAVRTPNKSSAEIQDLMTGTRLVHLAAADIVNRHGETVLGKSGYSHVGVLTAGTNTASVSGIRANYKRLFLLVDGMDYPGGNAKICSQGFDRLGHGAAVCVGPDVTAAWLQEESDGSDFAEQAAKAADRLKGNVARYVTIL